MQDTLHIYLLSGLLCTASSPQINFMLGGKLPIETSHLVLYADMSENTRDLSYSLLQIYVTYFPYSIIY